MKTLSRYVNILAASRAKLGLTQEQMAMQLGISKSMVKLVETNRRSLSTDKLAQVAMMEQQLEVLQLQNKVELPASMKNIYKDAGRSFDMDLQYLGHRCTHRAMKLKKQLKRMEREHEALRASLLNLEALEAFRGIASDGLAEALTLNRPKLLKKIVKCSGYAQEMTRKKIAVLQAEAALYQCIQPDYVHTNEKPILSPLKQTNMEYTLSMITSQADCHAMINMANDDKEALAYRKNRVAQAKTICQFDLGKYRSRPGSRGCRTDSAAGSAGWHTRRRSKGRHQGKDQKGRIQKIPAGAA